MGSNQPVKTNIDVKIVEVGARDGLQNLPNIVPVATRIELILQLQAAGLTTIEAGAFVAANWIPQMASSDQVLKQLQLYQPLPSFPVASFPVLIPNLKGYKAAQAAGAQEVAIFTAASDTFNRRNTNSSINESLERFKPLVISALKDGIKVRGYVSCAVHCPFEGFIPPAKVKQVSLSLLELGCYEVSLGDTTGRATAGDIRKLITHLTPTIPVQQLAGHFHDTYGQGLTNALAALELGVQTFDTAIAGLGGCPYSPGASGNLATEDLVYLLDGLGLSTGVNLQTLVRTGAWISSVLQQPYGSKAGQAFNNLLAPTSIST